MSRESAYAKRESSEDRVKGAFASEPWFTMQSAPRQEDRDSQAPQRVQGSNGY
jgi:hypothetical protein